MDRGFGENRWQVADYADALFLSAGEIQVIFFSDDLQGF
jgi:hypothetical protein